MAKTMKSIFDIVERNNMAVILIHKNNSELFLSFIDNFTSFNARINFDDDKDTYMFFRDKKFFGWTQNKDVAKQYFDMGYPCFRNSAVII